MKEDDADNGLEDASYGTRHHMSDRRGDLDGQEACETDSLAMAVSVRPPCGAARNSRNQRHPEKSDVKHDHKEKGEYAEGAP